MGRKLIDLTGNRFGRLVVVERGRHGRGYSYWLCQCDCGIEKEVSASSLKNGNTKSCGCLNREVAAASSTTFKSTHGMSGTPIYIVYQSMIRRCNDPRIKAYPRYGGRGIRVCREWVESFEAFFEWASVNGYKHGLTIDRKDNNGNYCPSNCRWATMREQGNNRSNNRFVIIDGIKKTASQWAHAHNIPATRFLARLNLGWDPVRALKQRRA